MLQERVRQPRSRYIWKVKKPLMHPSELAKASHMRPGDPRVSLLAEVSGLEKVERFYHGLEDDRQGDDGPDSVVVQQEGEQELGELAVAADVGEGAAQPAEAGTNHRAGAGEFGALDVVAVRLVDR